MKNHTKLIKLLTLLIAVLVFSNKLILAQAHDPGRGLYIDGFAATDNNTVTGNLVPAFSILGQTTKEDSLLKYCAENHITYIILYNLSRVLDNDTLVSSKESALCSFMRKARNSYGITKIGAIIGSINGVDRVYNFQQRQMSPTLAYEFTNSEKASSSYQKLQFVENTYAPGDSLYDLSEVTKAALNISRFNKLIPTCSSPDTVRFDVINIELEFWNNSALDDFPSQPDLPSLYRNVEQPILDKMAQLRYMNDSISPLSPIKTEIYLGYLNKTVSDTDSTLTDSVIVSYLDGQLYSDLDTVKVDSTNHRLLDRFLLAYYSQDPNTTYYRSNYFNRLHTFDRTYTMPQSNTIPLFSAATIALGYDGDFFGVWFPKSNRNNIFEAEKQWYSDWLADTHPSIPIKNYTEPGQSVWFTSSIMTTEQDNPSKNKHTNTFYSNSPINTYGAASASAIFTYCGPIEDSIIVNFKLDSAGTVIYNLDTITKSSFTTIQSLSLGSKDLKPFTYTGIITLDYGNGQTYIYHEPVIVSNGLKIQSMGPTTFCEGGSGVILKSGKINGNTNLMRYHWFIDSIPLYNDSLSAYYFATQAGNYYCRVDSTNTPGTHFAFSNSILVTVLANSPASITETALTGGAARTLIPNGTSVSGTTYAWNTGATTQNLVISEYDTYEVIITQPSGCQRTASIDVNEIICNSPNFDWDIDTNSDTLATNSLASRSSLNSGDSLILHKNIHFDKNFRLDAAFVICEPNTKIVVDSSYTLRIVNGTQINKCSDLWKGIEVKRGGTLIIDSSSVIKGAIQAVYSTNSGFVQIKNSTFDNNYKSIYLANGNYSTSTISGNYFSCSGAKTLPPPYYNQRTWAQIHINHVHGDTAAPLGLTIGGITTGSKNYFSNSDFGIVASESSFDAYNNDFGNIQYDTISEYGGIAIVASSPEYEFYEENRFPITIGAVGSNSANIFHNCYQGVFCSSHQTVISGNHFTDVKYGVAILPNLHWSTDINYNRMTNTDIGIDVFGLHDNAVNIDHNRKILVNAAQSSTEMTAAIRVLNFGVSRSGIVIQNNDSIFTNGTYGILAVNEENIQISQNKVYLNQNSASSEVFGLRLENCFAPIVNCNLVKGNARAYTANKAAISLTMAPFSFVDNNTTNNSNKGLEFISDCDKSIIHCNSMVYHNYGLTLGAALSGGSWSSGIIGDQDTLYGKTHGNRFFGKDSAGTFTGGKAMLSVNSDAGANLFWVDNSYYPPLSSDTLRVGTFSGSLTKFIPFNASGFTHDTVPTICRYLFRPAQLEECCLEEDPIDPEEGEERGEPEEIVYVSRNRNSYNELKQSTTELSYPVEAFIDSMSNTNSGALSDVQIILREMDNSLKQSDSLEYVAKKNAAIDRNNEIFSASIFETNEQHLNAILLSKSDRDKFNFNENERQDIEYIAFQCPYKGGKSVFQARSLVYQWKRNVKFDDNILCDEGSSLRKAKKTKSKPIDSFSTKVFPNPTTGNFSIQYDLRTFAKASLIITDVLGKIVYSQELNSKLNLANANIMLEPSIYFVRIIADEKPIEQIKITVIK